MKNVHHCCQLSWSTFLHFLSPNPRKCQQGGVESACLLHNIPNERNFLFLPHKYFVVAKSAETWYLLLNVWIKFCRQLPPSRGHFPFGIVISDPVLYQFNPPPDLIKIGHKSNKSDLFQAISKGKSLKTGFIQSDCQTEIGRLITCPKPFVKIVPNLWFLFHTLVYFEPFNGIFGEICSQIGSPFHKFLMKISREFVKDDHFAPYFSTNA